MNKLVDDMTTSGSLEFHPNHQSSDWKKWRQNDKWRKFSLLSNPPIPQSINKLRIWQLEEVLTFIQSNNPPIGKTSRQNGNWRKFSLSSNPLILQSTNKQIIWHLEEVLTFIQSTNPPINRNKQTIWHLEEV